MTHRTVVTVALAGALTMAMPMASTQAPTFAERLEAVRAMATLPAVAGAHFSSAGVGEMAAMGVRRLNDTTAVSVADLWHIGSITKSFTSLLVGKFVERGTLKWESTLAELVGVDRAGKFGAVTLSHLLSHRAGLPETIGRIAPGPSSQTAIRQRIVDAALAGEPQAAPGVSFRYANAGYVIAGAILEAKSGKLWEDLVKEEIAVPLNLLSAGYGPPGVPEVLSQPRGHRLTPGQPVTPVEPGPGADNPVYLGPAGRLHMTIADLARWGHTHLRGERGQDGIVSSSTFKHLHQPDGSFPYAMGWISQRWEGRRVIWHNGSNTLWFAIVAFDPGADRGVAIVTNGGIGAAQAIEMAARVELGLVPGGPTVRR
jgi:CubicO group peptidase (beta-lactamase class C family)